MELDCACKQVASCGGREGVLVSLRENASSRSVRTQRGATVADWRGQRTWHSQVTILEEATPFFWPPSRALTLSCFLLREFQLRSQVSAIPAIPWVCAIPEPPNTPDQRLALRPVRLHSIALLASAPRQTRYSSLARYSVSSSGALLRPAYGLPGLGPANPVRRDTRRGPEPTGPQLKGEEVVVPRDVPRAGGPAAYTLLDRDPLATPPQDARFLVAVQSPLMPFGVRDRVAALVVEQVAQPLEAIGERFTV